MTTHNDKTSVVDSDPHFIVDPITRKVMSNTDKSDLVQSDHNSERITFECPRYIEGHDMLNCNEVIINYLDNDLPGVYEVDDLKMKDSDTVMFSWLISSNATQKTGKIFFAITFMCVQTNSDVTYRWNTAINEGLKVIEGMNQNSTIVYDNVDILEQWKQQLFGASDGEISKIQEATNECLKQIPSDYSDLNTKVDANTTSISELKESISDLQGSGSGLNNAAKNILLNILKNAIYTTDQVNNINELGKALAGDVYSITNNLTHCTSSNTELSVAKGNSYTTTIIADSKYVINSCRVTMKGIDITDSVYSNGKITINSVTGNVVITVVAEKGTDNLIKKSQCTSGNLGNGASADGSTAFITPFIEVEPSTVYKHNITTTLSDGSKAYNQYFELYDANKTRLNTTQINTGGAAYESITEYTNNASTHYIRILFNADHKNPYFGKSGEF